MYKVNTSLLKPYLFAVVRYIRSALGPKKHYINIELVLANRLYVVSIETSFVQQRDRH